MQRLKKERIMSKHDIAENIRKLAGTGTFDTFVCTVKSIENATCTVVRVLDDLEIPGVRLNCHSTENSGIVITPKVDSYVLVTSIDGHSHFVSQCSEVEKITINCNTKITINDGKNDGIIKIKELTQKLNNLVNTFNSHTHEVSTEGTAAAQTGTAAAVTAKASKFNQSDYEDTKVTH